MPVCLFTYYYLSFAGAVMGIIYYFKSQKKKKMFGIELEYRLLKVIFFWTTLLCVFVNYTFHPVVGQNHR